MIRILFVLAIVGLFACTPQRRFTRLIEKHPHLLTTDSVTLHDTVLVTVPEVKHDTIFSRHFFTEIRKDTLVIQKERLTVQIYHDTIHDSVFVSGKCDTVTVEKIIERKVPVRYYEKTPTWKKVFNWIILIFIITSLLYIAYRIFNFIKKKI